MILGISLQWHSEIDEELLPIEEVAIAPEARSLTELCFPLRSPIEVPAGPRWTRWEQVRDRRSSRGYFYPPLSDGDDGDDEGEQGNEGGEKGDDEEERREEKEDPQVKTCPSSPSNKDREGV